MPNPSSTGQIILNFPTHPPPLSHHPLLLFRPSHSPLAVIGVTVCARSESLASLHAQFGESLIDVFPPGSVFPLAKNCFVYDESDGGGLNLTGGLPGLIIIPSAMGNRRLYIGTLLANLVSNVLGEFAAVVSSINFQLQEPHRLIRCTGPNFRESSWQRILECNVISSTPISI